MKGHPLLQWEKEETMNPEAGKRIMRREGWNHIFLTSNSVFSPLHNNA